MIEKYTIQCPYPKTKWNEVEITSDNLIYSEATTDDGKGEYIGIQCNNLENEDLIKDKCIEISKLIKEIDELIKAKCIQVANLIREIDELNKPQPTP